MKLTALAMLVGAALGQLPNHPPVYMMNLSSIIMPCNNSGFTSVESTRGWVRALVPWP